MRVISGIARGRTIKSVKGTSTRPTLDRVKEAVFNVLANKIPESIFLDLFSGTGNIGIEALSRGAKLVYFNDTSYNAQAVIKENLTTLGFLEKAKIFKSSGDSLLANICLENLKFNIIYLDPPYDSDLALKCLTIISSKQLLVEKGVVVVESSYKNTLPKNISGLEKVRADRYGDTEISYWQFED